MSERSTDKLADWMGFSCVFTQPESRALVAHTPMSLGAFLNGAGDAVAEEPTEAALWYDTQALRLRARCRTSAMDRVRDIAKRRPAYGRDTWGDDALEVQIDVGLTRREYAHFILTPTGLAITSRGFNNRQVQGWHPDFSFSVSLEDDAWVVTAEFPFAILGQNPGKGEEWGLNLLRVNGSEKAGYSQWSPTFGDALRPELFGTIRFGAAGDPVPDRATQIEAYSRGPPSAKRILSKKSTKSKMPMFCGN